MYKPLELFIGLRYTRAKRRNHFISFISAASMAGIAIGVMALITVLSVMNGFEQELRNRILGMASHATISAFRGGLEEWPVIAEAAQKHQEVEAVAPYIDGEGMVRVGGELSGTLLRGVLPDMEAQVSDVSAHMKAGSLDSLQAGEFKIVLGVFMVQGTLIGLIGTLFGVVLGVLLAINVPTLVPFLERLTNHQFLDPSVYYISKLPSQLESTDVVRIALMSFVLAVLSGLYPAWRASRVMPAEALRYE